MWPLNMIEKATYLDFYNQISRILCTIKDKKKIAVWGASIRGMIAGIVLEKKGIMDFVFIDTDTDKQKLKLNGHGIYDYKDYIRNDNYIIIVSMENNDSVINLLEINNRKYENDYYCLELNCSEDISAITEKYYEECSVILGASCLHILPINEVDEEDLAQMINIHSEYKCHIMGSTCLGMKNIYYLCRLLMKNNINFIKNITIILSWETITVFHHMLPRTQKTTLSRKLYEIAVKNSYTELIEELKENYDIAKIRCENYQLEKEHSISLFNKKSTVAKKKYISESTMADIDVNCEEVYYFIKAIDIIRKNKILPVVIIEPMNYTLCRNMFGEHALLNYDRKCKYIHEICQKYHAYYYNASYLIETDQIISEYTANEALKKKGRMIFAEKINEIIK